MTGNLESRTLNTTFAVKMNGKCIKKSYAGAEQLSTLAQILSL